MNKHARIATLAAAVSLLAACGSTPIEPDKLAPVESRSGAAATAGAGSTTAPAQSQVASVDLSRSGSSAAATAANAALMAAAQQRVVYFDFDSFAIRDEFKPMLDAHARLLSAKRSSHMTVEGHTDERGSREYNLALGQKRAAAVVQSLVLLGATESQLEAVSYGKERPAVPGSDEAAWAKNRRAELKDR